MFIYLHLLTIKSIYFNSNYNNLKLHTSTKTKYSTYILFKNYILFPFNIDKPIYLTYSFHDFYFFE